MMLFGFIFLGLALTILAVCIISISWWFLIPAIVVLVLAKQLVQACTKLFGGKNKKDEIVTMSRAEFEANYQRRT